MPITRMRFNIKAQLSIELIAGLLFLIPIILFLMDLGVVVVASSINDDLAKHAARSAANAGPDAVNPSQPDSNQAQTLAAQVVTRFRTQNASNQILTNIVGDPPVFVQGGKFVSVTTHINVNLPVPIPFVPSPISIQAKATESTVGIRPI